MIFERTHNRIRRRLLLLLVVTAMLVICFSPSVLAADAVEIKLSAWDRQDTLSFDMQNMLPGDSQFKTYDITITDKRAGSLYFDILIKQPASKLAEVLSVEVSREGDILYDGLMAEMDSCYFALGSTFPQTVSCSVRVYLDGSVGNEYMGYYLEADFRWTIVREGTPDVTTATTTEIVTVETTTVETTTTEATTAETIPGETTTVETTTVETTTVETTEQSTTHDPVGETTTNDTYISFFETTTVPVVDPPETEYRCDCCIGYYFPYCCNFRIIPGDHCELPWCCNELGIPCWCPWCWIVPLLILILSLLPLLFWPKKKLIYYCDMWLQFLAQAKSDVDPITFEKYKNAVEGYIKPEIGKVNPKKLTAKMLEDFKETLSHSNYKEITQDDVYETMTALMKYCREKLGDKVIDAEAFFTIKQQFSADQNPMNDGGDDLDKS